MRIPLFLPALLGLGLAAQTPPPAPGPAVKWRGALWASGAASNQSTSDGSLFLRSADSGEGHLAVDGLQLGADVTLADGWSLKFTLLAGQAARFLNAGTLAPNGSPADTGSFAWPEAQLVWTGGADTLKFGRMYTPMGMEVLDPTQDITASRGLLFTYAIPVAQVGLNWHHAFSTAWSADLWVYNGEDRVQDNNKGKTAGLGLTYNHGGASDRFVTLMAFSGAEQNATGGAAGAEGRKRERLCLSGGWAWGKATLLWEGESARETLPASAFQGATGPVRAAWSGAGLIGKYQFTDAWSGFARAEVFKDDTGVRLGADPSVAAALPPARDAGLRATSFALGAERRWHATFTRLEIREDSLGKEVADGSGKPFKSAASLTWSVGTSF
ncbi:outer membrane beta-barrel protein [Geothrix sp. 21YS21S-2]|uniref:outer membrane beta-barrel protein n=1 Tax=Geothrix sp. 21YS21S-2 TaxID=3068893 RepID=UPI0027B90243|nr:outer membrane beta-barrel protein [Geothrix sp. 21YS21S-2]